MKTTSLVGETVPGFVQVVYGSPDKNVNEIIVDGFLPSGDFVEYLVDCPKGLLGGEFIKLVVEQNDEDKRLTLLTGNEKTGLNQWEARVIEGPLKNDHIPNEKILGGLGSLICPPVKTIPYRWQQAS